MALKRHLHYTDFNIEHSKCVLEEAQPALKRLRISEADVQAQHNAQSDQYTGISQQQSTVQAAPSSPDSLYPFNTVLKQLHLERMQRVQQQRGLDQQEPPSR